MPGFSEYLGVDTRPGTPGQIQLSGGQAALASLGGIGGEGGIPGSKEATTEELRKIHDLLVRKFDELGLKA